MSPRRAAALAIAALLVSGVAAAPAPAATGYAKVQAAPAADQRAQAADRPAGTADPSRRDDAEQRGHVIPDEDSSPNTADRTPPPAPAPSTPAVSASPIQAQSPTAAPAHELPRTGGDDALLLLWFGALVAGAGACLRRAIA